MTMHRDAVFLVAVASLFAWPGQLRAEPQKPFYGIELKPGQEGPEIVSVVPGFTADIVGFRVGDILVEAGGKPISNEVLQAYLKDVKEGDHLTFKVKRRDTVVELSGKAVSADGAAPTPQSE